ncbi:hypothetical protein Scep_009307 [Stephania cephalantha]|uniref:Uncharacterized protein n=1 Tax=Stephania cephalantha TaxID=152367 RepID=A0AAP0JSW4_9MAGN
MQPSLMIPHHSLQPIPTSLPRHARSIYIGSNINYILFFLLNDRIKGWIDDHK